MKKGLSILFLFLNVVTKAQVSTTLAHCGCTDKVDNTTPSLEGKFERTCNGILIEKGGFKGGLKDGEWLSYSKKGKLLRKINYTSGKLSGKSEAYFTDGTPKLIASFDDGKPDGKWTYYASNGNEKLSGSYEKGKPVGVWTASGMKGKSTVFSYDYIKSEYLTPPQKAAYKNKTFGKSDNAEEYILQFYPAELPDPAGTAPLGGFNYAASFFSDLVEIPLDYWNTVINYTYLSTYTVAKDNSISFKVERETKDFPQKLPLFSFLVSTNNDKKLKVVEHSELSQKLLQYKITEALSFLPPWIYKDKELVQVEVPYVINKLHGFSKLAEQN
jgi:hypothetical protein